MDGVTDGAGHPDAALVPAALAGDGRAVARVYDEHAAALYRLAACLLGSSAAAEKLVVEVLVMACTVPGALGRSTVGTASLRLALVRLTYSRCEAAQRGAAA